MKQRYQVLEGSQSGHCCFKYTVVDTARSHDFHKDQDAPMCETIDRTEADLICAALNKYEP